MRVASRVPTRIVIALRVFLPAVDVFVLLYSAQVCFIKTLEVLRNWLSSWTLISVRLRRCSKKKTTSDCAVDLGTLARNKTNFFTNLDFNA